MKTIIFDLDGTLLNTLQDLHICVNVILEKHNFPKRTITEIRSFVGNGIKKLMERAVPNEISNTEFEECYNEMLEYYKQHSSDYTRPYDNVTDLLKKLRSDKNLKIAIVTNKAQASADIVCKKFFGDYIDIVIGDDKITPLKPQPDNLYKAVELLKGDIKNTIYVGDSEVDILTAKNAGVKCIAVSWGFRDKNVLIDNGADIIVNDADTLYNLLIKN